MKKTNTKNKREPFFKTAEEFIASFTPQKFELYRIRKECFLLHEGQKEIIDTIHRESRTLPTYAGTYIGSEGNGSRGVFTPSFVLLELLAAHSSKKVFIDDKSAWLFLCDRDIFESGIVKKEKGLTIGDLVLVQNERDENLGYGLLQPGQVRIKNLRDRGDFLRREMKK